MSERKLVFTKGKVALLTLEELKQTHRENYPDGNPGDLRREQQDEGTQWCFHLR